MKGRLGKVDHVFPFVCNGVRKLTIEGRDYYSSYDETRFPLRDGSVIEYSIEHNEVTILAVQPDLLEVRTSGQPLFDNNQLGRRGLLERRKTVRR